VILVEHATVVTVDAERRIYADGSVLTDGDRILQVGPASVNVIYDRYLCGRRTDKKHDDDHRDSPK